MPKSEQIGTIQGLDIVSINNKLRVIQGLFDQIFSTFGDQVLSLKLNMSDITDSGSTDATEQSWIEIIDADGNTGYIRVYGSK